MPDESTFRVTDTADAVAARLAGGGAPRRMPAVYVGVRSGADEATNQLTSSW